MSTSYTKSSLLATACLSAVTMIAGAFLLSSTVSADTSVVDKVKIKVPTSCTMSGTGMNSHNTEIINGNYEANIGTTTLHVLCNDASGFAIYAAGYTGNEIGGTNSNKLVGTSASNNDTIVTGLATTAGNPDVSNWAMKLAITQDSGDITGTNAFVIDSAPNVTNGADASFSQYHVVPNEYTKVAHKNASTDMTANTGGAKLTTTYAAYISRSQVADTYTGQVKYTLVHPSNHNTPANNPATLDTGQTVNSKLKSLAATVVNGEETIITPSFDRWDDWDWGYGYDEYIKSIVVHTETAAPAGFTPSESNTISTSASVKPIYVVFDNTNDAGIMHFYTEGDQIVLSPDSSYMFYLMWGLAEISGISDWDTSNATDMSYIFFNAGENASTFALDVSSWDTSNVTDMSGMFTGTGASADTWSIGNLSSWDTSSVTDMNELFSNIGGNATTWSIGNLSSWDTSSVTDMSSMFDSIKYLASIGNLSSWDTSSVTNMNCMFYYADYYASTFTLDLSSWDTSNVTNMSYMFYNAGYSATTWSVGDLSSWDTSNVTNMDRMFSYSGYSATTWSVGDLSSWDTSNVTNLSGMFENAGRSATTWSVGDLSSWDTSSARNLTNVFSNAGYSATTWSVGDLSSWDTSSMEYMFNMFSNAGYSATTWSVGDLSSWDTSKVTSMSGVFYNAGYSATTFTLDLSSWDTSNVTNMSYMFYNAGYSATTFALDLSSWNTSNVTSTTNMFSNTGYSATTWSVMIPPTNGNSISNTTSRFYGKTTSNYGEPPSGKSFTLAQP